MRPILPASLVLRYRPNGRQPPPRSVQSESNRLVLSALRTVGGCTSRAKLTAAGDQLGRRGASCVPRNRLSGRGEIGQTCSHSAAETEESLFARPDVVTDDQFVTRKNAPSPPSHREDLLTFRTHSDFRDSEIGECAPNNCSRNGPSDRSKWSEGKSDSRTNPRSRSSTGEC